MWIGVLWAGLRVAMWITHVGGKFRHGLLEKSLNQKRPFVHNLGGPKVLLFRHFFAPASEIKNLEIQKNQKIKKSENQKWNYCDCLTFCDSFSVIIWLSVTDFPWLPDFLWQTLGRVFKGDHWGHPIHNSVCSQFWGSLCVRNSVWGSLNRDSRGNPSLCWLGRGGQWG